MPAPTDRIDKLVRARPGKLDGRLKTKNEIPYYMISSPTVKSNFWEVKQFQNILSHKTVFFLGGLSRGVGIGVYVRFPHRRKRVKIGGGIDDRGGCSAAVDVAPVIFIGRGHVFLGNGN